MKSHQRFLALLAMLALVIAACGGEDTNVGDDENGDNGNVVTSPSNDGDGNDDEGNNGGDGNNTLVPGTTFGNIPGMSDECVAVANLSLAISQVLSGTFQGVPDDVVDSLPAGSREDGQIIADALNDFATALADAGIDLSQGIGALSQDQLVTWGELSGEVFNDELEEVVDRFGNTIADECAPGG